MKILKLTDFLSKKSRKINEGVTANYQVFISDIKFNGVKSIKRGKPVSVNYDYYDIELNIPTTFTVTLNPCECKFWETADYYNYANSYDGYDVDGDGDGYYWDDFVSNNSHKIDEIEIEIDFYDLIKTDWDFNINVLNNADAVTEVGDEYIVDENKIVKALESEITYLFNDSKDLLIDLNCGWGHADFGDSVCYADEDEVKLLNSYDDSSLYNAKREDSIIPVMGIKIKSQMFKDIDAFYDGYLDQIVDD